MQDQEHLQPKNSEMAGNVRDPNAAAQAAQAVAAQAEQAAVALAEQTVAEQLGMEEEEEEERSQPEARTASSDVWAWVTEKLETPSQLAKPKRNCTKHV